MTTKARATVEDLYRLPSHQKAELVNGEIVPMSPTGSKPGRAAGRIFASLSGHEGKQAGGYAFTDKVGFVVDLPNRASFSPDAAWYIGDIDRMGFLDGAPAFAVEVRSENDYGRAAENAIAAKIADYLAAGTKVVWDVDLLGTDVIRAHRSADPVSVTVYRRGEIADAEPAVLGWTFPVDELFR